MLRLCLAALVLVVVPAGDVVLLEVRAFAGPREVTNETRITVHQAGDRQHPVAQLTRPAERTEIPVEPGIYDVQAVRERDGRVVAIRWAERLVVMAYPDEEGHHLEVINFESGFGALQVRARADRTRGPDVALFKAADRASEVTQRLAGGAYALFVVPAGRYDVRARDGDRVTWSAGIDIPLDRTRLVVVP